MSAPTDTSAAPGAAQGAAEALTLLDALARAPAAAALVVAALKDADRKALRLAHSQLRDAVGEETTKLTVVSRHGVGPARPPTPRRWPRLEELTLVRPDFAPLKALSAETWGRLRTLHLGDPSLPDALDAPAARALAAALRRMPALCTLKLLRVQLPDEAARALFRASRAEATPQLRALTMWSAGLTPGAARMLAASGWRLEALDLIGNTNLGVAGAAALLAAPSFALRCLNLRSCRLAAASFLNIANTPWPLEELDLSFNYLSAAAAAPALAALSRHRGLRRLTVEQRLSAAGFKALVEAHWPALTYLSAHAAKAEFAGPQALGAAAFAGLPALEELDLSHVKLGEAGARLLASRCWLRLQKLDLRFAQLGAAGIAALARGEWPALQRLDLSYNHLGAAGIAALARGEWPALQRLDLSYSHLGARLALEDARRWVPALTQLFQ